MAATLLPALTGPYSVAARRLFLSDPRPDPFTNSAPRRISVTAWYPTAASGAWARYLSVADSYDETMALQLTNGIEGRSCSKSWWNGAISCGFFGPPVGDTMYPNIRARDTRAVLDGAIRTDLGPLPVVIFSPGFGVPGNHSSILAEDLASHGYLVLTISCTYESIVTEWSNGVIAQNASYVGNQWAKCLAARVGDVRYLLDQLTSLPNGIGAQADASKVAIVGHSFGGTTGMETAYLEPNRVKAVACLDGPVGYAGTSNQALTHGVPQPVMLLSMPADPNSAYMTDWANYANTNHGPLHRYRVSGTQHYAFTDVGLLCAADKKASLNGTIDPNRAMALHPWWTRVFLDTYVRGVGAMPSLPSPDWPEVTAI
ncbi:alpha/beta hydrolase family protein [Nocardia sp. Marseille-Q1738]